MHGIAALMLATAGTLALAACQQSQGAEENASLRAELTALRDRNAIEDLLYSYYSHLGNENSGSLSDYFTEDAVFEINGRVFNGRQAIQGLYNGMGGDEEEDGGAEVPPDQMPFSHTMLNNPRITVNGNTATAQMIWTGTENPNAYAKPQLFDQGREYDRLVKQDGKWLIQKRVIIADGFLPRSMADTWERKADYDITAE